jgi:hypothetical protein
MRVQTEYIGKELRDSLIADYFPKEDIKSVLMEMPEETLDEWMEYYISKEKYELCGLIKQVKEQRTKCAK